MLKLIETYGKNDQRTDAWHVKRGEMLTASEIYKALPDATECQKYEIVMSKLVPRPVQTGAGPRALVWGTRFEPIAKDIYCKDSPDPLKIVDTTCIPHPTIPFLGASPDGILVMEDTQHPRHGRLVEFKCPISRNFSQDTPIPPTYIHQMQLQMECSGLTMCEYIEFQFRNVTYTEWMDSVAPWKGFFAESEDTMDVLYKDIEDPRTPSEWRSTQLTEDKYNWNLVYWVLEKYVVKVVEKDTEWLNKYLPSFTDVWNTVLAHRAAGTLPEHPKEKTTLTL